MHALISVQQRQDAEDAKRLSGLQDQSKGVFRWTLGVCVCVYKPGAHVYFTGRRLTFVFFAAFCLYFPAAKLGLAFAQSPVEGEEGPVSSLCPALHRYFKNYWVVSAFSALRLLFVQYNSEATFPEPLPCLLSAAQSSAPRARTVGSNPHYPLPN